MQSSELFIYLLLLFGWVVFQVLQRVFRRPKPLGTLQDEVPPSSDGLPETVFPPDPLADLGWGRAPDMPLPEAQAELTSAGLPARRRAPPRPLPVLARPRRHPHRPRLRNHQEMRDAVVMAAVIGPCRAMDDWQAPGDRT